MPGLFSQGGEVQDTGASTDDEGATAVQGLRRHCIMELQISLLW